MLSPKDSHKTMEDTNSSFSQFKMFDYHHNVRTVDYHLLRQDHLQALRSMFINGAKATEDDVVRLFDLSLEETNLFVQRLLEQLTEECRKNNYQKEYYEKLLRKNSIVQRKHSQQIFMLSNKIQNFSVGKSKEIEVFLIEIKKKSIENQQIVIEMEGLKKLLAQYQNQLERLNREQFKNNQEKEKESQVHRTLSNQIIHLQQVIQKNKQIQSELTSKIFKEQAELQKKDTIIKTLSQQNSDLLQLKDKYQYILTEKALLSNEISHKDTLVEHLEIQLLRTTGLCVKRQLELKQFKEKEDTTNVQEREKEWKIKFSQLEDTTKQHMAKLKQYYEIKTKKLLNLLQKQIVSLKTFASKNRLSVQKQLLLGWKLMKNDLLWKDK